MSDLDSILKQNPDVVFITHYGAHTDIIGPDAQIAAVADYLEQQELPVYDNTLLWRVHYDHPLREPIIERSEAPEYEYPSAFWVSSSISGVTTIGMSPSVYTLEQAKAFDGYGIDYSIRPSRFTEISEQLHDAGYTRSSPDGLNSEFRYGLEAFRWLDPPDDNVIRYSFRLTVAHDNYLDAQVGETMHVPTPRLVKSLMHELASDPNIRLLSETCQFNPAIVDEIVHQRLVYAFLKPYFTFVLGADAVPDDGKLTDAEGIYISGLEEAWNVKEWLGGLFTQQAIEDGAALHRVASRFLAEHGGTRVLENQDLFYELCRQMSEELERIFTEDHPEADLKIIEVTNAELYRTYKQLTSLQDYTTFESLRESQQTQVLPSSSQ